MHPIVIVLAPVMILGLPVYFFSKFLERKIHPRKNFRLFLWWLLAVLGASFTWYFICMFTFFKFFSLRS
ncbi:hypothetical protein BH10BAC2_BH10BAC2_43030 [soil metagenome]